MILSDRDLVSMAGLLFPDGLDDPDLQIQPASVDLKLGNDFKIMTRHSDKPGLLRRIWETLVGVVDPHKDTSQGLYDDEHVPDGGYFVIRPGQFVLATTRETVAIPQDMAAQVDGRSSWGRLGIAVHVTAGYLDPCFKGQVTLEIVNHSPWAIMLRPGDRICQVVFIKMTSPSIRPYGHSTRVSKYQGQSGVTESRSHLDYNAETTGHGDDHAEQDPTQ